MVSVVWLVDNYENGIEAEMDESQIPLGRPESNFGDGWLGNLSIVLAEVKKPQMAQ